MFSRKLSAGDATARLLSNLVAGDPSFFGNTFSIAVEDVVAVSGTTTSAQRWLAGRLLVTVRDGRLTIHNAPGGEGNKICFVEITQVVADIRINFQPGSLPGLARYVADVGVPFGNHWAGTW